MLSVDSEYLHDRSWTKLNRLWVSALYTELFTEARVPLPELEGIDLWNNISGC